MSSLTLELIAHGDEQELILPMALHVHKRTERFLYSGSIRETSVPISYLESKKIDSWDNLQVANLTHTIGANSPRTLESRSGWTEVRSTSYSSQYKQLAITHIATPDERGIVRPLFYKHILPSNTVECSLYSVERGNRISIDSGYLKDISAGLIYTNYKNFFDYNTGAYRLFYVVSTDNSGVSTHQLLSPIPVVSEAECQDIDLDTGKIKAGLVVFTREQNSSGYTFYFSKTQTYYVRPIELSLIQPLLPSGRDIDDSWYLRFSNADFSTLVNGKLRRYWIPEYDTQSYFPSKPIIYSSYRKLLWVNSRTLTATRKNLAIDPSSGLHLVIYIYDVDEQLIRVLTTNTALEATRYSNTDIFYETDKIQSWDNVGGFIGFGMELLPGWQFAASYYYRADDVTYVGALLNPLYDKQILEHQFVFYIRPDRDTDEQAIQHLVVDQAGRIVQCSESELKLYNEDGSFNSNTVIGLKYRSDLQTDTFINQYTVGFDNDYAYYVLAEVVIRETSVQEDILDIDVSRAGAVIAEQYFAEAIIANPRILQSHLGYGEQGQEVPSNAVMIIRPPLTLLEGYGGSLTQDRAEQLLLTYNCAGVFPVIEWQYPASVLTGYSIVAEEVRLSWTWEGPDLTYALYRRYNTTDEWELVTEISSPSEGEIVYLDSITTGTVVYYSVRIKESDIEFPASNSLAIKVA